jgi:hypothetical protein
MRPRGLDLGTQFGSYTTAASVPIARSHTIKAPSFKIVKRPEKDSDSLLDRINASSSAEPTSDSSPADQLIAAMTDFVERDARDTSPAGQLRWLVARGKVVPVIGAGVSKAVAGAPDWPILIKAGAEYARAHRLVRSSDAAELLGSSLSTPASVIDAATTVRRWLEESKEFGPWLHSLFSQLHASQPRLLGAIWGLKLALIVTTNYDRLLSGAYPRGAVNVFTWKQPSLAHAAIARDDFCPLHVFHLHGVFDEPESVIFGERDYGRLAEQRGYEDLVRTLWIARSLVFIGSSLNGLDDPDFFRLITWASDTFGNDSCKHYILARAGEIDAETAEKWSLRNIETVVYGESFDDLPIFLQELWPLSEVAPGRWNARLILDSGAITQGDVRIEHDFSAQPQDADGTLFVGRMVASPGALHPALPIRGGVHATRNKLSIVASGMDATAGVVPYICDFDVLRYSYNEISMSSTGAKPLPDTPPGGLGLEWKRIEPADSTSLAALHEQGGRERT